MTSQFQDGGLDVLSRIKVLCCHLVSEKEVLFGAYAAVYANA